MAPEQLDGREVDTRADVFAFGAVLYETVTGLKAFEAETPARVLSAILRDEPARVSTLVPVTPAGLDELIHTCLAKDPNERWQGMGDVARQLRWLQSGLSSAKSGSMAKPVAPAARGRSFRWWPIAAAVLAGLAAGAVLMRGTVPPVTTDQLRLHAFLLPPEGSYLTGGLTLSQDGRHLAFVATDANGDRQLWIRQLDSSRAQPLAGTAGASDPFWAPSSAEVAFFANDELKRIPIGGGGATVISEAGIGAGGTWNADGTIVFQPHQQGRLMQVPAAGGRPEPATTLDAAAGETHHLYPSFLPDGRHYVFYVAGTKRGLYVGELGSSERSFLFDPDPSLPAGAAATPGVYAETGHLLYVRDRVLMARRFDAASRTVTGEPIKIADTVDYNPPGQAAFAIARSVLVYRPRQHLALGSLMWIDRRGNALLRSRRVSRGVPAIVAVTRRTRGRRRAARRAGRIVGVDDRSGSGCHGAGAGGILERVAGLERRRIGARLQHRRRLAAEYRRPRKPRHLRRTAHHEVGHDALRVWIHAGCADHPVSRVLERHGLGSLHGGGRRQLAAAAIAANPGERERNEPVARRTVRGLHL